MRDTTLYGIVQPAEGLEGSLHRLCECYQQELNASHGPSAATHCFSLAVVLIVCPPVLMPLLQRMCFPSLRLLWVLAVCTATVR
jgi:hypothetical protein